jgi:hypothetical protein
MVGEGPPSTSLLIAARKAGDGRPSPTMTTRGDRWVTRKGGWYKRATLELTDIRACERYLTPKHRGSCECKDNNLDDHSQECVVAHDT